MAAFFLSLGQGMHYILMWLRREPATFILHFCQVRQVNKASSDGVLHIVVKKRCILQNCHLALDVSFGCAISLFSLALIYLIDSQSTRQFLR